MNTTERQWAEQIAARVGPHLAKGLTMLEAVEAAHTELQALAAEMAVGQTRRSRMAAKVIGARVYAQFQSEKIARDTLRDCQQIDAY